MAAQRRPLLWVLIRTTGQRGLGGGTDYVRGLDDAALNESGSQLARPGQVVAADLGWEVAFKSPRRTPLCR
jgi:hypothetical protein